MTNLWVMLLVKSTFVLCTGLLASFLLRSRPAAIRHLVWLSTLCALLVLPAGFLIPENAAVATVRISASLPDAGRTFASDRAALQWPLLIWLTGTALLTIRLALSAWLAARLVRRSAPGNAAIRFAAELASPVAWSFGRGTVLLPDAARRWPGETVEAVVRHECAHIARRDSHALLAAELAGALYWFHPLVWVAIHRMRLEGEHAADDAVVAGGADPAEYAAHLLSVARGGLRSPLLAGAGHSSTLAARIRAVLDLKRRRSVVTRRMWCASAMTVLAIALPLAAMQQGERRVYKVGEGFTPPQIVKKVEPRYTPEAKEAKIQGTVLLEGVIEADGHMTDIVVQRGIDPGLDANGIEAVQSWLFKPATKDGEAVAVRVKIEINFRLLD